MTPWLPTMPSTRGRPIKPALLEDGGKAQHFFPLLGLLVEKAQAHPNAQEDGQGGADHRQQQLHRPQSALGSEEGVDDQAGGDHLQ